MEHTENMAASELALKSGDNVGKEGIECGKCIPQIDRSSSCFEFSSCVSNGTLALVQVVTHGGV